MKRSTLIVKYAIRTLASYELTYEPILKRAPGVLGCMTSEVLGVQDITGHRGAGHQGGGGVITARDHREIFKVKDIRKLMNICKLVHLHL